MSDVIKAQSTQEAPMSDSPAEPPLAPFKDEVLGALISGVATLVTTRAALAGLTSTQNSGTWRRQQRDPQAPDASRRPRQHTCTTLLLNFLPASAPARDAISARARYQHVLNTLSTLYGLPPLFKTLVEALIPRLVAIAFPSLSSPGAYLHALLVAIKRALASKVDEGHADVAGYYADSLVPVLYGLCGHAALHDGGRPATDARVVGVVGNIIGLVVQSLAPTPERNLLVLFEARYIHRRVTLDADINARVCAETILVQSLAQDNERRVVLAAEAEKADLRSPTT
ncbi:hypothetical protein B0H13DRAFT_2659191, partial [Mycena leptocephala]